MKAFFFILSLALSQMAFAQLAGGWSNVDPATVESDPGIQEALEFGAHYVVEQGIKAGDFADGNYEVTGIYSVSEQVVAGMNYQFDVEITGDDGTAARAQYEVFVQSWTNTIEVTSWAYQSHQLGVTEGEGELGEFDFLPEEVYVSEEDDWSNWSRLLL